MGQKDATLGDHRCSGLFFLLPNRGNLGTLFLTHTQFNCFAQGILVLFKAPGLIFGVSDFVLVFVFCFF